MANFIQKDNTRRKLVFKNEIKRLEYKSIIKNLNLPKEVRYDYVYKLNNLNRNSSKIRVRNRCILTGRGRSTYSFCKLSRLKFRELAAQGRLAGIKKASW
jgi:small subunit ribosomal protein S14